MRYRSVWLTISLVLLSVISDASPADAQAGEVADLLCTVSPLVPACALGSVDDIAGAVAGRTIDLISGEIGELASGVFTQVVAYFGQAALSVLEVVTTWWIDNPSLIRSRGDLVERISSYFYSLTIVLILAGFIWQGIRMMVQRRGEPAIDLAKATLTYMFAAAGGVGALQAAAAATDAWAGDIVSGAFDLEGLPEVFGGLLLNNTALFLLFSIVVLVFGVIQALLLVLREISLILLSGMILLAASGQYFRFSKSWLGNLIGMVVPILLWKPVAAMLIAISLEWISGATGPADIVIGLALFALSVLCYGPLQKVFAVFAPGAGAGGGGGLISAAGSGALGAAALMNSGWGSAAGSGAGAVGGGGAAAGGAGAAAAGPVGIAAAAGATAVRQGEAAVANNVDPTGSGGGERR